MATTKKVRIVALMDERKDACLTFATALLRLQMSLLRIDVQAVIEFSADERAVLENFAARSDDDQLIVLDTMIGFSPEMVIRMIENDDRAAVVVGVYPLPQIDWDAVHEKLQQSSEVDEIALQNMGLTFNVGLAAGPQTAAADDGYAEVVEVRVPPRVYRISRRELAGRNAWSWNDPSRTTPIVADVAHQCSSFGPLDYVGCVGLRSVIR